MVLEQLIPHWRLGSNAGINLEKVLLDPPEVDLIGIFQGYSLAPYAETGRLISTESLERFDQLTQGNSPIFAILLN